MAHSLEKIIHQHRGRELRKIDMLSSAQPMIKRWDSNTLLAFLARSVHQIFNEE